MAHVQQLPHPLSFHSVSWMESAAMGSGSKGLEAGLKITVSPRGLQAIDFCLPGRDVIPSSVKNGDAPESEIAQHVHRVLQDYFSGDVSVDFNSIPLDLQIGTPFQRSVWKALQTIPFGEVQSYRWIAEAVGSPKAFRAVGQANSKNPIPIIIPCHRVIAADGKLGGYMGAAEQGLNIKRFLMNLEGIQWQETV